MTPPPPRSTLFPYTTLFRSCATDVAQAPQLAEALAQIHVVEIERDGFVESAQGTHLVRAAQDRKSTRLNSSHTVNLVCRLLLEKKKKKTNKKNTHATIQTTT